MPDLRRCIAVDGVPVLFEQDIATRMAESATSSVLGTVAQAVGSQHHCVWLMWSESLYPLTGDLLDESLALYEDVIAPIDLLAFPGWVPSPSDAPGFTEDEPDEDDEGTTEPEPPSVYMGSVIEPEPLRRQCRTCYGEGIVRMSSDVHEPCLSCSGLGFEIAHEGTWIDPGRDWLMRFGSASESLPQREPPIAVLSAEVERIARAQDRAQADHVGYLRMYPNEGLHHWREHVARHAEHEYRADPTFEMPRYVHERVALRTGDQRRSMPSTQAAHRGAITRLIEQYLSDRDRQAGEEIDGIESITVRDTAGETVAHFESPSVRVWRLDDNGTPQPDIVPLAPADARQVHLEGAVIDSAALDDHLRRDVPRETFVSLTPDQVQAFSTMLATMIDHNVRPAMERLQTAFEHAARSMHEALMTHERDLRALHQRARNVERILQPQIAQPVYNAGDNFDATAETQEGPEPDGAAILVETERSARALRDLYMQPMTVAEARRAMGMDQPPMIVEEHTYAERVEHVNEAAETLLQPAQPYMGESDDPRASDRRARARAQAARSNFAGVTVNMSQPPMLSADAQHALDIEEAQRRAIRRDMSEGIRAAEHEPF